MARRARSSGEGLRELVIAHRRRFWDRWRIEGRVGDMEYALKSGAAVKLDAYSIASALRHSGLDDRRFAQSDKVYLLDEHDRLTECVGDTTAQVP